MLTRKVEVSLLCVVFVISLIGLFVPDGSRAKGFAQPGYPPPPVDSGNSLDSYETEIHLPIIASPQKPPSPALSIYVKSFNDFYQLGQLHGQKDAAQANRQNSYVVLAFGYADHSLGYYGFTNWNGDFYSIPQVKNSIQSYATAYLEGIGPAPNEHINIILGINNHGYLQQWFDDENLRYRIAEHGRAWGQMVFDLNTWAIQNHYDDRVTFMGGMDIEPEWSEKAPVEIWAYGYIQNSNAYLWNFGTAPCDPNNPVVNAPPGYQAPAGCGNGWNQEDIYNLSHGNGITRALPEIYLTTDAPLSEGNARNWFRIGLIGIYNNVGYTPMFFEGVLTQHNACMEDDATMKQECINGYTYNTSSEAYDQMQRWLAEDGQAGVHDALFYTTDIWWYEGVLPADWRLP